MLLKLSSGILIIFALITIMVVTSYNMYLYSSSLYFKQLHMKLNLVVLFYIVLFVVHSFYFLMLSIGILVSYDVFVVVCTLKDFYGIYILICQNTIIEQSLYVLVVWIYCKPYSVTLSAYNYTVKMNIN